MKDFRVIHADILTSSEDFIAHQVNCQGAMRSGVAKAIREKYTQVYTQYREMWSAHRETKICREELLGKTQYVQLYNYNKPSKPYYCINMFAQDNYGYGGQFTSIEAFKSCLVDINEKCKDKSVAFPWKIGCVRGGADWDTVLDMICTELVDVSEIVFYKLNLG